MSATNEADYAFQNGKGQVKEETGKLLGDDGMRAEGKGDQIAAHARQLAGKLNDSAKRGGKTVKAKALDRLARFHDKLHEEAGSSRK